MQIKFIEIQNFRKLKSVRLDLADQTTLFVGANNSGKTSAMAALRRFLVDYSKFTTNDFTVSNWSLINKIGRDWQTPRQPSENFLPTAAEWENLLPAMDVWLQVAPDEVHHVSHLLPSLDWDGGILGVRLRLEPKDIEFFYKEYIAAHSTAQKTILAAKAAQSAQNFSVPLWPESMMTFLERGFHSKFTIRSYTLDSSRLVPPTNGRATPQILRADSEAIDENPFGKLIRIDEINAQRGFSDAGGVKENEGAASDESRDRTDKRKLSDQLRSYYSKHIDPNELPEPSDVGALQAIFNAQTQFDEKLKLGFANRFKEVEDLGYPGIADPKLIISTKIRPMDGFNHPSALQYELASPAEQTAIIPPRLPEQYNGLGYQNLISMVFKLMSFRDDWMQVGKVGAKAATKSEENYFLPPLHLVLVEEPEAHLHVQVQQVFIRKAYGILRAHENLGTKLNFNTQLIVSTHSSHIAHECEFACLRYFRRVPAILPGEVPTSSVINLSEVFGAQETTSKFVTRYLKATHCDLFFADAAILVEGPVERMFVPHFIREHFPILNQCYITLLEIGGSHAHRLRALVEHLGLITLVVTDIDCADAAGRHPAKQPVRGKGYITRNETLKSWVPEKSEIDALLNLGSDLKEKRYDSFFAVRVAYQCPITVQMGTPISKSEALANTFEDALVFENLTIFKDLEGNGLMGAINAAIQAHNIPSDLGLAMFEALQTGGKAEFALELLFLKEPKVFKVPGYISEGLEWLQTQLKIKQLEIIPSVESPTPVTGMTA